jgi:uncharacterized repeat protein (TIGR03803 family)
MRTRPHRILKVSLRSVRALLAVAVVVGLMFAAQSTRAQSFTLLYSFAGPPDGANPWDGSLILDARGNLYGTTLFGGNGDNGTVLKLSEGGKETLLYRFGGGPDGSEPHGAVVRDSAGRIYGATFEGGTDQFGTLFVLNPDGKETVLHSFSGQADGRGPNPGLVLDAAGNLYGTAGNGGDLNCVAPLGCGTIFELATDGTLKVLHAFTGPDGSEPVAA